MSKKYDQAPLIVADGKKNRDKSGYGTSIRTKDLETLIMKKFSSAGPIKLMLFLTSNKPNSFRASEKTVLDRCGMSHSTYTNARKALKDCGWVTWYDGDKVIINYDIIYGYHEEEDEKDDKTAEVKQSSEDGFNF